MLSNIPIYRINFQLKYSQKRTPREPHSPHCSGNKKTQKKTPKNTKTQKKHQTQKKNNPKQKKHQNPKKQPKPKKTNHRMWMEARKRRCQGNWESIFTGEIWLDDWMLKANADVKIMCQLSSKKITKLKCLWSIVKQPTV